MQKAVKQGEVYYANLPKGIGSEQAGRRPVLIVERTFMAKAKPVVTVSPITSQIKSPGLYSHVVLPKLDGLPKQSMVELEQITTIDKCRLMERRCCIDETAMKEIKRAIKKHFDL